MVSDSIFLCLIDTDALDLESSIIAPRLPRHPGFEGKYLQPSDSLFRSPQRLGCVNVSKVGISTISHLTDISRS